MAWRDEWPKAGQGETIVKTVAESAPNYQIHDTRRCGCHTSRRRFLISSTGAAVGAALIPGISFAQSVRADPALDIALLNDIVSANQILAHEGVLDAYGHVSVRDPRNPNRFWMSRSVAPAQVTAEDIMEYDLDCNPLDARGRVSYYERWIHGETYKARPDVHCVVHSHSLTVIPFSVTNVPLRPLLQQASFLALGAPVYDNRPFLANSDLMIGQQFLGREMAKKLGPTSAVLLLRGHGDVVVAPSIRLAVFRAYYTEINARAQEQAIALGGKDVTYMTPEEGAAAEKLTESPPSVNRSWQLWKQEIPG
jgi:HCOMODA/2-hydroxy-3-carboxy-muconic semialdehyde decarboxylase